MSRTFNEGGTIPLDRGGFVYVLADINKIRSIFDIIPVNELKSWQAVLVINGTSTAAAALFPVESGRRFQVVGWGAYPSFRASLALFIHRNWRFSNVEGGSYWYSNADRLSVRLTSNQINALAWNQSQTSPMPAPAGVEIPAGFMQFRHRWGAAAPLSLWMEAPNSMLSQMLAANIPSDLLYANIYPEANNQYRTELRLRFDTPAQASSAAADISALSPDKTIPALAAIFFASPPVLSGRNLYFESALLSDNDIAYLMHIFVFFRDNGTIPVYH